MNGDDSFENIIFNMQDDSVIVEFQNENYRIGYLDLTDNERIMLETSNFKIEMKIDSKNVSFAVDRFVLNRLSNPDELYEKTEKFIQCSTNENIVKFQNSYYFADSFLVEKLKGLARSYLKDIEITAFCLNDDITTNQSALTLRNAHLRIKRKIVVHFGPFQFVDQFRKENANVKRYVIDEHCRFIQIDDHLINSIDLTTSNEKISIETMIKNNEERQQSPAVRRSDWRPFYMSPSPMASQSLKRSSYDLMANASKKQRVDSTKIESDENKTKSLESAVPTMSSPIPSTSLQSDIVESDSNTNISEISEQFDNISLSNLNEKKRSLIFGLNTMNAIKVPVPEIIKSIVRDDAGENERNEQICLL